MNKLWFSLVTLLVLASACSKNDEVILVGDWEKVGDFSGPIRGGASSFTIDGTPYICLGLNSSSKGGMNDLWRYDVKEGIWVKKAEFPGPARFHAVAFSVGKKGYVGLGRSQALLFDDFYEYDSERDTWKQIANFPGGKRFSAAGAGIGGKGYVGTGYDENMFYNDFYRFTPNADAGIWESISGYSGSKRMGASLFVLGGKMYLFGGTSSSSDAYDFHCFDPATGAWRKLRSIYPTSSETYDDDYASLHRKRASTFIINNLAYVTLGDNNESINPNTFEYNADTDLWVKRTAWEGYARTTAIGFYYNNRGFVATGNSGTNYLDDVWEFHPIAERNEDNNY